MPRKKPIAYNGGHIRPTPNNTFLADICLGGDQARKTHKTIEDAEAWIDEQHRAHVTATTPVTTLETQEARAALDMLPDGVGLLEAADFGGETRPQNMATNYIIKY